ncbi:MAG: hypothetical protein FWD61_15835 [Phycisphaerales bacterium]|nr:hypothetical protein [Phycisphaerales bacterium]
MSTAAILLLILLFIGVVVVFLLPVKIGRSRGISENLMLIVKILSILRL